jgi:glycosyltransferase involved in cell wall biosynthesis
MTPDFPLVSIITPVYNGALYLDELIQSVQAQAYPKMEHIVIDDGSADDGATVAVLRKYPHLRWWSRENRGQYATMNEGLTAAQGELVCFVSADDMVLPGAVDQVVDYFRRHQGCDGVAGFTQAMDEQGRPYPSAPFQTVPARYYAYFSQISHCSLYLRRGALIQKNLVFDPALHYVGDYDWMIRVVAQIKVARIPLPLSKVRIHSKQASRLNKRSMFIEQLGVVKARRVNPVGFRIFRDLYILLHNLKKLFFALATGGLPGVGKLVTAHLQRDREGNRR